MPPRLRPLLPAAVLGLILSGCSSVSSAPPAPPPSGTSAPGNPLPARDADADAPTGWGPTVGELAVAREVVRQWQPEQLAGQVIVGRYHGPDPQAAASMVAQLHLAGVCMTTANITSAKQVRASTAAVHQAVHADGRDFPAVIGVDQEGGVVSHLRGIAAEFPPFIAAGAAAAGGVKGLATIRDTSAAMAMELRDLGYTWVFAPVTDTTIGPRDPTIGTRAPSDDPQVTAAAAGAATAGMIEAGLIPTPKHYPGHGSVTEDSHRVLPVQDADLATLQKTELQPFTAVTQAHTPAIMVSHIAVQAIAPDVPASLAPQIYDLLEQETGFDGVAITDSLGMGAVMNAGGNPSIRALQAGADLLLMPADTRAAHAAVTAAIIDGSIPRDRIEDAAAKVVAVQQWQSRLAKQTPVPADAAAEARAAARQLSAAALTQVSGQCTGDRVSGGIRIVGGSAADRASLGAAARATGVRVGAGTTVRLVSTGSGGGDVVVALDWPSVLADSRGSEATYALYGRTPTAFAALMDVLTGKASAPGGLPVKVPGVSAVSC